MNRLYIDKIFSTDKTAFFATWYYLINGDYGHKITIINGIYKYIYFTLEFRRLLNLNGGEN